MRKRSRLYYSLKSRYTQNKKCRKTFAPPSIQEWKKPKKYNINKVEIKFLNETKSIEDIVIVQTEKGGKIAIMDTIITLPN